MLSSGTRFDHFEVLSLLGIGGMGEVYRARDLRLGREVALKCMPGALTANAERHARFEQEARVLAALNHPNIASLFEVVRHPDGNVLVLELVEGENLSDRIARGALPAQEALAIATQIAQALEAAHDQGIIHRDLKPSNVRLRADGVVKLLDFGLAKLVEPTIDATAAAAVTLTAHGAPGNGMPRVLGSPACMSPEQARGEKVDRRTDVWAFGCVLFEMLSGTRAFPGDHPSDVLARVLERAPDLSLVPPTSPAPVHRLLRRCFEKDRRRRLRDVGDARLDLVEALEILESPAPVAQPIVPRRLTPVRLGWVVAALALAATGAVAGRWWLQPDVVTHAVHVARFQMQESGLPTTGVAISPDGQHIAYVSTRGLTVRNLDSTDVRVIAPPNVIQGNPFFSPDGQWIGFRGWDALRKIPVAGGAASALVDGVFPPVGAWLARSIYFGDTRGLYRIPDDGGKPELLVRTNGVEQIVSVAVLPSGKALLYSVAPTRGNVVNLSSSVAGTRIEALDLRSGKSHVVIQDGSEVRYASSGHVLYSDGKTLYAAAFDAERLQIRGAAVPVLRSEGSFDFDISADGTLVYQISGEQPLLRMVWVDRQGKEEALGAPPMHYIYPRLSPDEQRIAVDARAPNANRDIWIWNQARATLERFTKDAAGNPLVTWSPDGKYLVFGSEASGVSNVYRQAADGTGEPELLRPSDSLQMPISHAPDGRVLVSVGVPGQQRDIHLMGLDRDRTMKPLIEGPANELWAEVSPDGRWLAYDSDESGQFEIYVRPFPDPQAGGRWQVSSAGGRQPLWSPDGRELFYRALDGALLAVPLQPGATFSPGRALTVFNRPEYAGAGATGGGRTFDVTRDGHRFLVLKSEPDAGTTQLFVVLNWFEELRRLAPNGP